MDDPPLDDVDPPLDDVAFLRPEDLLRIVNQRSGGNDPNNNPVTTQQLNDRLNILQNTMLISKANIPTAWRNANPDKGYGDWLTEVLADKATNQVVQESVTTLQNNTDDHAYNVTLQPIASLVVGDAYTYLPPGSQSIRNWTYDSGGDAVYVARTQVNTSVPLPRSVAAPAVTLFGLRAVRDLASNPPWVRQHRPFVYPGTTYRFSVMCCRRDVTASDAAPRVRLRVTQRNNPANVLAEQTWTDMATFVMSTNSWRLLSVTFVGVGSQGVDVEIANLGLAGATNTTTLLMIAFARVDAETMA